MLVQCIAPEIVNTDMFAGTMCSAPFLIRVRALCNLDPHLGFLAYYIIELLNGLRESIESEDDFGIPMISELKEHCEHIFCRHVGLLGSSG